MRWYEIIILIIAILLVIVPIVTHFVKKKNGSLKCECGHLQSECGKTCTSCNKVNEEIRKLIDNNPIKHKYIVYINGMKCGMCETHINDVIRSSFNVTYVKSYRDKKMTIITSELSLNMDELTKIISNEGYDVVSINQLM